MKAVASIGAILFFPLAVMFAIERAWQTNSLAMIWLAIFAFVSIVGFVLGFVFGRCRINVMFAAGAMMLFIMWLPLQISFVAESGFINGVAYFVGLLVLTYASLLGGGIGYSLISQRGS